MHDREEREEQERLAHRELRIENVRDAEALHMLHMSLVLLL